jgi:2-iminobutanoate/2-iminopropanoate deaminase
MPAITSCFDEESKLESRLAAGAASWIDGCTEGGEQKLTIDPVFANAVELERRGAMNFTPFTRRNLAGRLAAVLSGAGLSATALTGRVAAATDQEVRKLDSNGKPADGKQMITPIVVHNGLLYVAGQGAHDPGPAAQFEIGHHTTIVMDNVKKLVEAGGGTVDSILQLTVFLADIKYYDGMNQVFKTYFPNGGPARTTIAVAALPGNSLVEINCIAAVIKK